MSQQFAYGIRLDFRVRVNRHHKLRFACDIALFSAAAFPGSPGE